ncbi:MAG TPA: TRAP transporter small permease subunit [Burkholderiales bacterium]|jgi:TRAP-type mannitol/chloroaromatic compound transport system permease small subunit|nr:TRAP transporter small permease subunit [Burkholderiales bacterium]
MRLEERIARLVRRAGETASWLYLVVVLITAYEVTMRYLLNAPTLWVHELSVALAATCFVIGGPYVHQDRHHIAIGFFYERMSPAARRWSRALGSLFALAFCGFLTFATLVQAGLALKVMEKTGTALNWPIPVYLKTLFAVCAVVMTLQSALHFVQDVSALRGRAGRA